MNPTDRTVKVTLEGDPVFVEATAQRLEKFFTVTYKSKYQHIQHNDRVRRYLRLLPPDLAHGEGVGGQGSGAGEEPARDESEAQ